MENELNRNVIAQTLGFHGMPLIKTWNEEKGSSDLVRLGIQQSAVDTTLYHARLKVLNFTDRTKRMRLHRFICDKAESLFKHFREDPSDRRITKLVSSGGDSVPPFEYFANIDKDERLKRFFAGINVGDIAYCSISQVTKFGLLLKVLCTTGSASRLVSDINVKGIVAPPNIINALDAKSVSRPFVQGDYLCCEVLEKSEHPQLNVGMRGIHERYDNGPPLGLIQYPQFPVFYKIAIDHHNQSKTYNDIIKETESFKNPGVVENLFIESGLQPLSHYSFMSSSRSKFAQDEYAKDLRQLQASKLAFRSVAEGIEHFKEGRHTEAFQCLNKALSIDPRNVEGLVARGALYANSGSFAKAIVDFEAALKLNLNHANAKKYLCETLLALGRNNEEENKFEEAKKIYMDCLKINPLHQEAAASLEYLKAKLNAKKIVEPTELELPPLNIGSIPLSKRDFQEPSKSKDDSRKKSKKDKKRKGKKRHSSSSDSSSDSSDSSDSSSSDSENSSTSSDSNSRSKKKDKKRHEKSLSPLSKRMDLGDSKYQFNHSFEAPDDHAVKVRKFLEMGRDEDDYEDKVRQLMAETTKYQKSKQAEEAKSAKKKKKSDKKLKKEKKKRKKEEKKKSKGSELENLREALKMFENLPEFSKFQKIYNDKVKEEEKKQKQGDNDDGAPEKWKMKFAKDERQGDGKSKVPTKNQFGFSYDSDDDEQARNFQGNPSGQSSYGAASTSGLYDKNKRKSSPPKPKVELPPVTNHVIPKGPVVLDKFGNFRLADPVQALPPKPLEPTSSTRRSRSRSRRRSRSRSNSRSPRRRRSSSYRRRYSRSRSYSRSYSRSRSRSRGRRVFRGRGGFNNRPRFSPKRMGQSSRGRWENNYRDNRDFRGGRVDRFNNRDRGGPRGGRFGGGGGGGRFNRSFSRSPERSSPTRQASPDSRRDDERRVKERDGRWGEEDSVGKPDLDEMEEILKKARKEKMDDMMERNKDLVKKTG